MPILNYTSGVKVETTVNRIQKLLQKVGCQAVTVRFDMGAPKSVIFGLEASGNYLQFRLPANPTGVLAAMRKDAKVSSSYCNLAQAERTAWRIVEDWLKSQFAVIESGQTVPAEVFLPYAIDKQGKTLYENLLAGNLPLLKN